MNRLFKVLIVLIITLVVTITLMASGDEGDSRQVLLLKGSATLQKSYSNLFLLVNEITIGEAAGQVDFLTAQATIEAIKYTLMDSRDYFTQAKEMAERNMIQFPDSGDSLCRRKIEDISGILRQLDTLAACFKEETVPAQDLFRSLNGKFLETLRLDINPALVH